MRLIVSKTCPFAQRAWITVNALQLDCDIEIVDLKNKPKWFLQLTSFAKVPILIDDQQRVLWESLVVSNYLNNIHGSPLSPADPFINAVNEAWIGHVSTVMSAGGKVTRASSQAELTDTITHYQQTLEPLEQVLTDGPYFNGEQFCLIDAFYAPRFLRMDIVANQLKIDLYDNLPKMANWATSVIKHPAVKTSTVSEFEALFINNSGFIFEANITNN